MKRKPRLYNIERRQHDGKTWVVVSPEPEPKTACEAGLTHLNETMPIEEFRIRPAKGHR